MAHQNYSLPQSIELDFYLGALVTQSYKRKSTKLVIDLPTHETRPYASDNTFDW